MKDWIDTHHSEPGKAAMDSIRKMSCRGRERELIEKNPFVQALDIKNALDKKYQVRFRERRYMKVYKRVMCDE